MTAAGQRVYKPHEKGDKVVEQGTVLKERECLLIALRFEIDRQQIAQKDVAAKAGVTAAYLSQILRGRKLKSLETLENVANACGLTMEQAISMGRRLVAHPDQGERRQVRRRVLEIGLNPKLLRWIPQLEHYVAIVNQAAAADDKQLAVEALKRLAFSLPE